MCSRDYDGHGAHSRVLSNPDTPASERAQADSIGVHMAIRMYHGVRMHMK